MQRRQWLEIEDQSWCPAFLRDGMTDYLQHVVTVMEPYKCIAPRLQQSISAAKAECVVDLGSGGGGPWLSLHRTLMERREEKIPVLLTDRFPNEKAARKIEDAALEIRYAQISVDATRVPESLTGFRTMFSSFHHFPPSQAQAILEDAVRQRQGIGIFELTSRQPAQVLSMILVPLFVLLITPFIRPFRLSRLVFTYLLPLIPVAATFDGIVSCLRTYTTEELREMTLSLEGSDYQWQIGQEKLLKGPGAVTYLIGYPMP